MTKYLTSRASMVAVITCIFAPANHAATTAVSPSAESPPNHAAVSPAAPSDPRTFTFADYVRYERRQDADALFHAAVRLAREEDAATKKRSDEVWAKVLPQVLAGNETGKPYIPWAAKPEDLPQATIPAFPGAWGGGMYSFGGRGGRVLVVTNLNDSGPGSFREAVETAGPRIVIFNVAGIIRLKEPVHIRAPYITIAGSTAPGDGVCIAHESVNIDTHDVVVRHMRFRRGQTWMGDFDDALGGNAIGNIMIDHVSCSWALDENLSLYRHMYQPPDGGPALKLPTVNITIQNSIISESLVKNGSTIGGLNSTFHRNLWASNTGRNPSIGMYGDFTFANNVLYNWRDRSVDGGDERSFYTIINNYYKPGPMTPLHHAISHRLLKAEGRRGKPIADIYGRAHVSGNVVEGNARVSADNWDGGVDLSPALPDSDKAALLTALRSDQPWAHAPLPILSATEAYEHVLAHAGASLPVPDAVDRRILEMTRTGTASFGDGEIKSPKDVGGYPAYSGIPYLDTDGDGLPDAWEKQHGLDPRDARDAHRDINGDGYTNIEDFINGLDPAAPKTDWTRLENNRDPRHASPAR